MLKRLLALALALAVPAGARAAESPVAPPPPGLSALDDSLALESAVALRRGAARLAALQAADGAWAGRPAVTAQALVALLNLPPAVPPADPAVVARGLDWLRHRLLAPAGALQLEEAAVGALGLARANRPEDRAALLAVRARLLAAQATGDGADAGGFPAAPGRPADPAVTAAVLETLLLTGSLEPVPEHPADLAFLAARRYLHRYQAAGGAATAQLVLGLMYARTAAADPALLEALAALPAALEESRPPAAGQYAALLATVKACGVWERSVPGGAARLPADWRGTVARLLLERQDADGAWRGVPGAGEDRPELATALALAALELAAR